MPIFNVNGKKILFIHVPKTGGTSIETYFGKYVGVSLLSRRRPYHPLLRSGLLSQSVPFQHLHASLLVSLFEPGFFDAVFMVVRDPMQRLISEYRHSRAMSRPETILPFSAWLRVSLMAAKIDPCFRNNHFRPQSEFRYGAANILHYEDGLEHCIGAMSSALSLPPPDVIPHERRSMIESMEPSQKDRLLVLRTYYSDYDAFERYRPAVAGTPKPARPVHAGFFPQFRPSKGG